uniref:BPI2 domain-containing protein n=1 Tax=Wuchereria bancrofti TaxID=6293 RepID=A0A1I8F024_WUCBA
MKKSGNMQIALWLANTADECLATPGEIFIPLQSALRVRFSDDIFHQLSRVVGIALFLHAYLFKTSLRNHLFKKYVKQVIIPPQQQCFPEGCVKIQDFQLVAHQNPSYVGAVPTPPNLIVGTLYGHLQPLPLLSMTIPTYGTLAISANQLVVEATFDIQKTVDNVPYIRVVSCSLINEVILAWVENMGLFTIIVNTKYQHEITMKTRQILEETLCITVNNVVNNELNSQLLQIPNQISIFDLYQIFFENSDNISGQKMKRILGSESNYLQVPMQLKMQTTSAGIMLQESQLSRLFNTASYGHKLESIILNSSSTFPTNVALQKSKGISSSTNNSWENSRRKLSLLILSLSILDTSATYGKFFIGLDGDVYIKAHDQTINSYQRPKMLRFSEVINADAVDLLVSEYTINTLLLKAHIIGVFVFNVSSTTPVLGKLIRTSCGIDEVCLSDSIPEVAETYPNKQLEIIIRTTEEIGLIPFSTTIQCNVISLPSRIAGLIKIRTLQFHEHIDFFGLTLQSLDSFKEAAKGAMMKMVNEIFREGISLNESATSRLSNTSISLVDRGILLQTKFNIERSFYQQMPISV